MTEDEEGKIKKILGKIKIVSFTKNDLLTNDFAAVFVGSEFCGYQFTAIENTKIFLPKNYFRYDKYDFVNQYNIIRAYKFYNLNSLENKILLIGEKAEGKNIYSFAEKRYIYNYLTFEFDYM